MVGRHDARDAEKFDRLQEFGAALGKTRGQVARDLALTGMPREKVVAAVVSLLELTLVRVGNEGEVRPISSSDVNEYLRTVSGHPVTAKDFRTWAGTLLAADHLAAEAPPESERMADKTLVAVLDVVSSHLRNTRAVCRASYVHPVVIDWYRDGSLPDRWHDAPTTGSRRLLVEERKLLALLRSRHARHRRAAA